MAIALRDVAVATGEGDVWSATFGSRVLGDELLQHRRLYQYLKFSVKSVQTEEIV